ncbi:MAG: PIN domain-containing protein [Acidimicrobiia bacterium]|nr:PIN domain-containing protein [Acidimicrobiia bacterium]
MTTVVDASAVLAFLQGEVGSDLVESHLVAGAACGAANWSEVAQKVRAAGRDWTLVRALLESYDLVVEPVVLADAEWAAQRWQPGEGLSLADRLCLALAERLDTDVLTADRSWGDGGRIHQLRN